MKTVQIPMVVPTGSDVSAVAQTMKRGLDRTRSWLAKKIEPKQAKPRRKTEKKAK
jgi:hypothetical protein